jgi:FlaA1/EpsC-like NDP-sugar epimerase
MPHISRRYLVFLLDLLLIACSYVLAIALRFDFAMQPEMERLQHTVLIVVVSKGLVFFFSRLYRSMWKYASLADGVEIFKTVTLASVAAPFAMLVFREHEHFSRVIFLIDWIILLCLMMSSRLVWRVYREMYVIPRLHNGPRTLIVGAGEAGYQLLREIRKSPAANYNVIGFVDDDPEKIDMLLGGVKVMGDTRQLSQLAKDLSIEKVIIAIPSASGRDVRTIIRRCKMANVRFKILPGLSDLISGKVEVSHIKDVEIDDLLGREPAQLDDSAISGYLAGKRVLVTGAGGSIGSEICRQVARYAPGKLVMLDSAETPLFHIERELSANFPELMLVPVMADIRNLGRLECLFDEFMPEVVFHAAAYKHVPMMEYNPIEAVTNNIVGSRNVAEMADRFGTHNFVMISTDKAVNPTNIMGASKRAAECSIQALAVTSSTKFTTVRFGNVLGSNGSVIPTFKEQIKAGGPVTVTDPAVVSFFMSIPEASQLVLQAGCLGRGGDIFVLDMGEPVPILELAEELIRLSGLEPYEDIDITFTGLRPGEKMYEELLIAGEDVLPTTHEKIRVMAAMTVDKAAWDAELDQLYVAARSNDIVGIIQGLRRLVPEYTPAYHFNGDIPASFRRMRPDVLIEEYL